MRKLKSLIKRWWVFAKRCHAFCKESRFLENGIYHFDPEGGAFYKHKKDLINKTKAFVLIFVLSFKKTESVHNLGRFYIRKRKKVLIFADETFYQIDSSALYAAIKKRCERSLPLLPYVNTGARFLDSERLMITATARGRTYCDPAHAMMNFSLLEKACIVSAFKKCDWRGKIDGLSEDIYLSVQHGDFHDENVFWEGQNHMVIDLDTVDWRPLFYDLLYYGIHLYRDRVNEWIGEYCLEEKMRKALHVHFLPTPPNLVDIYLACYALEVSKNINKETTAYQIESRIGWTKDFNFAAYPLTFGVVEQIRNRIATYNDDKKYMAIKTQ